jgi:hypothetical protein
MNEVQSGIIIPSIKKESFPSNVSSRIKSSGFCIFRDRYVALIAVSKSSSASSMISALSLCDPIDVHG